MQTLTVAAVAAAGQAADLPAWRPGQRFTAQVAATFGDGRVHLAVGTGLLEVKLPDAAAPGSRLPFTVLRLEPLTLLLQRPEAGPTAGVRLSQTGRLLAELAAGSGSSGGVDGPGATGPVTTPPVTTPPVTSARLAPALKEALTGSGLFYESHLAQWSEGRYALGALRAEPQAALAPDLVAPGPAASDPVAPGPSTPPLDPDRVPEPLAAVVQRQLHALETRELVWQGLAWPGQPMEWRVEERAPDAPEAAAWPWQTRLRLCLPRLGEVDALLRIGPGGVGMQVMAAGEAEAAVLRDGVGELRQALAAAGLRVSSLELGVG